MRAVNQPESWWGWHGWNQPEALSIVEIMQSGTLPPRLAAAFWLGLERGASFIFAAEPPGAGKTTLLTALLVFMRPETVAYFTRGWGETFDLPPTSDDYPTYLMVNEISDHLPVYSWGPYVVRIFELMDEGYSLCATVHEETVEGVLAQLTDEAGVERRNLEHLTFVVPMAVENRNGQTVRWVCDAGVVGDGGETVTSIAAWDGKRDTFSVLDDDESVSVLAERLGMEPAELSSELERRAAFLQSLLDGGVSDIPAVQEAVATFAST